MNKTVFLDRDGVLVEDVDWLTSVDQIRLLPDVQYALLRLHRNGFKTIVVTNQPVVARGLVSEDEVCRINSEINLRLIAAGAPCIDAFYYCPHHPNANLPEYRVSCDCRKPSHGLILRAAGEHSVDLSRSYMVGDRITDIIAGSNAGCRTILVETGKHNDLPIETGEPLDPNVKPDFVCHDLNKAVSWILNLK